MMTIIIIIKSTTLVCISLDNLLKNQFFSKFYWCKWLDWDWATNSQFSVNLLINTIKMMSEAFVKMNSIYFISRVKCLNWENTKKKGKHIPQNSLILTASNHFILFQSLGEEYESKASLQPYSTINNLVTRIVKWEKKKK